MKWDLKDIISINDFSREEIEYVLSESKKMKSLSREKKSKILRGKVIASLFFNLVQEQDLVLKQQYKISEQK